MSIETSCEALAAFDGIRRRLELRGEAAGVTVYDDFAHHPTAIAATLDTLRALGGTGRIIALVDPVSNTMRMGVHEKHSGLRWHARTGFSCSTKTTCSGIRRRYTQTLRRAHPTIEPGSQFTPMWPTSLNATPRKLAPAIESLP